MSFTRSSKRKHIKVRTFYSISDNNRYGENMQYTHAQTTIQTLHYHFYKNYGTNAKCYGV